MAMAKKTATAAIKIQFPHTGKPIETDATSYALVANGTAPTVNQNQITVAILSKDGSKIADGKVPFQPKDWTVLFDPIPVDKTAKYTVHIEDSVHSTPGESTFTFADPTDGSASAAGLHIFQIIPGSPTTGSSVPGSQFYVTGTSDPQIAVYAYIQQYGKQMYTGSMVGYPPNFVFRFQNVPPGAFYTIGIMEWSNPPNRSFTDHITVTNH
jgi:hypothetical protein